MEFYPTTAVNDAMNQKNTMDPGIKSVARGMKVMGRAYTVDCLPGAIITCHRALAEVPKGSVIVVDGHDNPNAALWGGLMTSEAIQKGVKGVIIDGAIRDVETINNLGFPAFSRYITPSVGSNKRVGTTGGTIVCGGVVVKTGDLVIGDDDGVVVIPQEQIDDILEKAKNIELKEAGILEKVNNGEHIADILGMSSLIKQAIEDETIKNN